MTRQWLIRLSWPEPALWQNRRAKLRDKMRSTKAQRKEAWGLALAQSVAKLPNAVLEFEFYPPDRRSRDAQNLPATMKAAIDGIADAMGCDDKGFRCRWPEALSEPVKGGAVLITVKEVDATTVPVRGVIS